MTIAIEYATEQTNHFEIAAIQQAVATLEHSQQHELSEEFIGLFRHDAIWTTGNGTVLLGRDEIARFTRQVLPGGMRGYSVTNEVAHVMFVRPDVASVKVRQRLVTLDGSREPTEGTPTFVMAKEGERWLLVACQNNAVAQGSLW